MNENMLPGDYVAGFVDGEGCFYLTYRSEVKQKRTGQPKYFRWTPYFAIALRKDDIEILNKIQHTLGCGHVFILANGTAQFAVQKLEDLYNKIIPFFRRYSLRAKKRGDFDLWCKAVELAYNKKAEKSFYTAEENNFLKSIREDMKVYKAISSKPYKNNPLL